LLYFVVIWYMMSSFVIFFFTGLVYCTKKNLATLFSFFHDISCQPRQKKNFVVYFIRCLQKDLNSICKHQVWFSVQIFSLFVLFRESLCISLYLSVC
jgi:hypothetical protein